MLAARAGDRPQPLRRTGGVARCSLSSLSTAVPRLRSYPKFGLTSSDGELRPPTPERGPLVRLRRIVSPTNSPTADFVAVADDDRDSVTGSMCAAAARVSPRQREDLRDEGREVVVGQVVERQLRRRAGDLLGGLEAFAGSRASAARGPAPAPRRVTGRSPRIARSSTSASRRASAVASACTLACRTNGPRPRRNSKLVRAP